MTAVIALLSFAVSCSKQEPEDNTIPGLAIHANPVMAAATGQFIDVTAGGAWELSITFVLLLQCVRGIRRCHPAYHQHRHKHPSRERLCRHNLRGGLQEDLRLDGERAR